MHCEWKLKLRSHNTSYYIIEVVTKAGFNKMSKFLFLTGIIGLQEDTVENLLSTSCLLQLSEVVEACCSFLMKQLHPSNCIGIRQFAEIQGCSDLYKVANNYVMVIFYFII